MSELMLTVLSLRYSSWSIRPWLCLEHAGASSTTRTADVRVAQRSPDGRPLTAAEQRAERSVTGTSTGLYPVLHVHGTAIHDSLAICEWAAESYPDAGLWPDVPLGRMPGIDPCTPRRSRRHRRSGHSRTRARPSSSSPARSGAHRSPPSTSCPPGSRRPSRSHRGRWFARIRTAHRIGSDAPGSCPPHRRLPLPWRQRPRSSGHGTRPLRPGRRSLSSAHRRTRRRTGTLCRCRQDRRRAAVPRRVYRFPRFQPRRMPRIARRMPNCSKRRLRIARSHIGCRRSRIRRSPVARGTRRRRNIGSRRNRRR
ncbi:MAG: glutathione S-transferase N-terminal domain-containing protein [Polyangiaceae bacterium]|nr:glutathione S-transferase N-terminal domain-containing protein [Polyangiaceae bacterium]